MADLPLRIISIIFYNVRQIFKTIAYSAEITAHCELTKSSVFYLGWCRENSQTDIQGFTKCLNEWKHSRNPCK